MNVFTEMGVSVAKPSRYREFLYNRKGKIFLYVLLLTIFLYICTIMIPMGKFQIITGGIQGLLEEYIPDFRLSNGILTMEKSFELDEAPAYISIDTDKVYNLGELTLKEFREEFRGYTSVLIMDAESFLVYNNGQLQQLDYSDLGFITFTKKDLDEFVPFVNTAIAIVCVAILFFQLGGYFFHALIVTVFSLITASVMKKQYSFGQIYIFAIYGKTLPLFLKAVASFLPITIPLFGLTCTIIAMVYVGFAMKEQ